VHLKNSSTRKKVVTHSIARRIILKMHPFELFFSTSIVWWMFNSKFTIHTILSSKRSPSATVEGRYAGHTLLGAGGGGVGLKVLRWQ
jgi:hypothetical protein